MARMILCAWWSESAHFAHAQSLAFDMAHIILRAVIYTWAKLLICMLVKNFSRQHFDLFPRKQVLAICMKCQNLFSEENIINLSSAELIARRVVKVNLHPLCILGNSLHAGRHQEPKAVHIIMKAFQEKTYNCQNQISRVLRFQPFILNYSVGNIKGE